MRNDFDQAEDNTPPAILVRTMNGGDIPAVMGLNPLAHSGAEFNRVKARFEEMLGDSLVAVEPRSKDHPHGMVVGYALLRKHAAFGNHFGLCEIFVDTASDKAEAYTDELISKAARVCMAKGQSSMPINSLFSDENTKALCHKNGAAGPKIYEYVVDGETRSTQIFTVEDLSGKFGYGASKKLASPQP